MTKGERTIGVCAYCGEVREIGRDHIPPENLFVRPYLTELITVPTCDRCNDGTSRDDEYLRLALSYRTDITHPSMDVLFPKIRSRLARIRAWKFWTKISRGITLGTTVFPSGLAVPVEEHELDPIALPRVIKRITRGLFFHHHDRVAPAADTAYIAYDAIHFGDPVVQDILARVQRQPMQRISRGEFAYQFLTRGPASSWYLRFYDAVEFLVFFSVARDQAVSVAPP